MFDEDDERRFPRLTLWQFIRGAFSYLFLATGWLASLGNSIWSLLIWSAWSERVDSLFSGKGADHERQTQRPPKEKGSRSEP